MSTSQQNIDGTADSTWRKKAKKYFSLKNILSLLVVSIILNSLGYGASFFCESWGILNHLSCALGFLSLLFACWGVYVAGSIKKAVTDRTVLNLIEKLKIKYSASSGDGSIKYLSNDDKNEAIQTLNMAKDTGKFLSEPVINAINDAIDYLEGKKKCTNTDPKPIYSVFMGYLEAISTASF